MFFIKKKQIIKFLVQDNSNMGVGGDSHTSHPNSKAS
jgi:hypothetical protein